MTGSQPFRSALTRASAVAACRRSRSPLGVMGISRHLGPICKGAGVGFLVGLATIATQDKGVNHILFVLSKPVEWAAWLAQKILGLSDGSTALMMWLGLGVYWMILGGLIGWGISVVYSHATGDE